MQIGMIGLGRMGANMVRRLLAAGHDCVVYDADEANVNGLRDEGATGAQSLADLVAKLDAPRAVWLMVPAGVVGKLADVLAAELQADDVVIDGGNSHYVDAVKRAGKLAERGIHFLDVGTSGGVWGRERGYCLMIGGDAAAVDRLMPVFGALAPAGNADGPRDGSGGFLHCGPSGAGHFVKMTHNGIEYGLMQAYAEGLNVLEHAGIGKGDRATDAETAPLEGSEYFRYDLDLAKIAEVWRHGSVIRSWLLDLVADALGDDPGLGQFVGSVSDSGEGRWTLEAAIDQGTPTPVLAAALFARFSSRGESDFSNRVLSALRREFGGHAERSSS